MCTVVLTCDPIKFPWLVVSPEAAKSRCCLKNAELAINTKIQFSKKDLLGGLQSQRLQAAPPILLLHSHHPRLRPIQSNDNPFPCHRHSISFALHDAASASLSFLIAAAATLQLKLAAMQSQPKSQGRIDSQRVKEIRFASATIVLGAFPIIALV
jgi:hypothetical protein